MNHTVSSNLEGEITLLVLSNDPEGFRASLCDMQTVGPYVLSPAELITIEDVYLDTVSRDFARQSWVLRIREENKRTLITLKGPSVRTEWGGIQRTEIEEPWSQDSWERIVAVLVRDPPANRPAAALFDHVPAVEILKQSGYVVIQDRRTRRDRRMVCCPIATEPVAELVLDRVTYRFRSREIRHMELEIEAKDPAKGHHAKALADALLASFAQMLKPWEHGKLATGSMVERLLDKGALQGLIRSDNYLMPLVYGLLESGLVKDSARAANAQALRDGKTAEKVS